MRFLILIVIGFLTACSGVHSHSQYGRLGQITPASGVKRIALTFDDAPRGGGAVFDDGNDRAKVFIENLAKAQTGPVGFFITTRDLDKPGAAARIESFANAGHLIANHSHTHQWAIRTETLDYLADIDVAEAHLADLEVDAKVRRPWFRFPFLDEGTPLEKRDALRAGLSDRGLMNGYVTVDNYDWFIDNEWRNAVRSGKVVNEKALRKSYVDILIGAVEFYDDLAVRWLGRSPVHVLLLHENDVNALYIGDLVVALRAKGWQIVSPDIAYADDLNSVVPQTLRTRQGHVAALAIEAGADPRSLTHLAIEENQIRALLSERGVFSQPP